MFDLLKAFDARIDKPRHPITTGATAMNHPPSSQNKSDVVQRITRDCQIFSSAHRRRFSFFHNLHLYLGLPSALLASVAGSLATIGADDAEMASHISLVELAGLSCSWLVALLTASITFFRPLESGLGHREKAACYEVLLAQLQRHCEFSPAEELAEKIEVIDTEIGNLKKSEPFLTTQQISHSIKAVEAQGRGDYSSQNTSK